MAVLLDARARRALADAIERLRPAAPGATWVAAENLHLTLKFLGRLEVDRVGAVVDALGEAANGLGAFELTLRGLGTFPSAARPRVVWAGVAAGSERLTTLAGRVERALAGLGVPAEERPFSPHVTLARLREPRPNPALAAALAGAGEEPFGTVRADRVVLMRSDLSPRGARYSEVAAKSLAV